jgi:hypothetical protein
MGRLKAPPPKARKAWYLRMRIIALATLIVGVVGVYFTWRGSERQKPAIGVMTLTPPYILSRPEPAAKTPGAGARTKDQQPRQGESGPRSKPSRSVETSVRPSRPPHAAPLASPATVNSIHVDRSPGAITGANININTVTTSTGPQP